MLLVPIREGVHPIQVCNWNDPHPPMLYLQTLLYPVHAQSEETFPVTSSTPCNFLHWLLFQNIKLEKWQNVRECHFWQKHNCWQKLCANLSAPCYCLRIHSIRVECSRLETVWGNYFSGEYTRSHTGILLCSGNMTNCWCQLIVVDDYQFPSRQPPLDFWFQHICSLSQSEDDKILWSLLQIYSKPALCVKVWHFSKICLRDTIAEELKRWDCENAPWWKKTSKTGPLQMMVRRSWVVAAGLFSVAATSPQYFN